MPQCLTQTQTYLMMAKKLLDKAPIFISYRSRKKLSNLQCCKIVFVPLQTFYVFGIFVTLKLI